MSSWGWVDFSKKDRELARDIIASLNTPGAVDELGIGVIRDGFADLFFPGTSTVQTIAKYFFLVAYQVEKLTRNKADNYSKALFAMEEKTSRLMWDSLTEEQRKSGNSGVFGSSFFNRPGNEWVKRPPSEIYWSGIRKLQLFTCANENISLPDFLQLAAMQNEATRDLGGDDDEFFPDGNGKSFHWDLPPVDARGDWENHPTVELTLQESAFLVEKIQTSFAGTMFDFVIQQRKKLTNIKNFADLEMLSLPEHLQQQWLLAQNFSNFIRAAQIQFNYLLKNSRAQEKWKSCQPHLPELAEKVDLDRICELLKLHSGNHHQLWVFLKNLRKCYIAGDIDALKQAITEREKALKGESRMKIGKDNPHYHDNWIGGEGLQYRFPDAMRLVNDILNAEGKHNA